ncbi:unnamed protein product [Brassica rapa subsp. narinosa]
MNGLVFSGISEKEDLILWFCFALVWFQTEHKEDSKERIISLKHIYSLFLVNVILKLREIHVEDTAL